jgi:ribosomal protein S18 acetylase RimI-like enzyme
LITIQQFCDAAHRAQVAELWTKTFGYDAPHNNPQLSIDKKLAVNDGLFFVATDGESVVGTIMAGYDGHRGWIYSVAVDAPRRRQGVGSSMVAHAERALIAKGCVKINLQVQEYNQGVVGFYEALGYSTERRINMGKRLPQNIPS